MANVQGIGTTLLKEALAAKIDGKSAIKAALYYATASITKDTAAYTATGEVTGGGYAKQTVTNANSVSLGSSIAYWSPSANITWTGVTIGTAFDACMLYDDDHASDLMLGVFTFGSQTITAGNFTLTVPAHSSGAGLIRLANA